MSPAPMRRRPSRGADGYTIMTVTVHDRDARGGTLPAGAKRLTPQEPQG